MNIILLLSLILECTRTKKCGDMAYQNFMVNVNITEASHRNELETVVRKNTSNQNPNGWENRRNWGFQISVKNK